MTGILGLAFIGVGFFATRGSHYMVNSYMKWLCPENSVNSYDV
jgi:hypothetical protein